MIKTERQGFLELLKIAVPYLIVTTIYSVFVFALEEFLGDHIYKISGQIGSVFGLAVAFFLGFRMNSAYDRWWEARKIYGELTNNSRSFAAKVYAYYGTAENFRDRVSFDSLSEGRKLIELLIFYIRQLKLEMHRVGAHVFSENFQAQIVEFGIEEENKISNEILIVMSHRIETHFSREAVFEKVDLMQSISLFYGIQGKAERIRNTPFLMIYSAFTKIIVGVYVVLMPLFVGDIDLGGEDSYFEFLSIPIMVVISTVFLTINKLANLYGEPFSENRTSVAIDDISRVIEQNCMEVSRKMMPRA